MKLLSKSDITKKKSIDRQQEIAEGSKLAKRVDALREISANEETALFKFRTETLSEISKETLKAQAKLDGVKKKIEESEHVLEELRPVDQAREELERDRIMVLNYRSEVTAKAVKIENEKLRLQNIEKDLLLQEKKLEVYGIQADKMFRQVSGALSEAKDKLRTADETLSRSVKTEKEGLKKIKEQESLIKQREKKVFDKEEDLRKRELELEIGWKVLKDRQDVFERNINRLNK